MIAIIDYGLGNIGSIKNMLKKIGGVDVSVINKPGQIEKANKLILPGVGSFDAGMTMLNDSGLREELDYAVLNKRVPILGICLGMQMLGRRSEEGIMDGLGYIPFECIKFKQLPAGLKVPHMGWDCVDIERNVALVKNSDRALRFYFVHSYFAVCEDPDDCFMSCDYGTRFAAAVNRDNIYGVQFHPEKSHNFGKWLLKNYVEEV